MIIAFDEYIIKIKHMSIDDYESLPMEERLSISNEYLDYRRCDYSDKFS